MSTPGLSWLLPLIWVMWDHFSVCLHNTIQFARDGVTLLRIFFQTLSAAMVFWRQLSANASSFQWHKCIRVIGQTCPCSLATYHIGWAKSARHPEYQCEIVISTFLGIRNASFIT